MSISSLQYYTVVHIDWWLQQLLGCSKKLFHNSSCFIISGVILSVYIFFNFINELAANVRCLSTPKQCYKTSQHMIMNTHFITPYSQKHTSQFKHFFPHLHKDYFQRKNDGPIQNVIQSQCTKQPPLKSHMHK